jgi:diguanylate cyclase (GGDEF)-like protein
VAAGVVRLLTAPLDQSRLEIEGAICAAVILLVVASSQVSRYRSWGHGALIVVFAACLAALANVGLRLAAPALPDFTLFATLIFAGILMSIDINPPRPANVVAALLVVGAFAELWVDNVPVTQANIATLVLAAGFLAGFELLLLTQAQRARHLVDAEAVRGQVFAAIGRKVGTARDVESVVAAVLEAAKESFPQATHAAVFLRDDTDGLLKTPGVSLGPHGLVRGGPQYELMPGEGLAGAVFSSGHAMLWPTALDISSAHSTLREANRERMRAMRAGFVRSGLGAALRPPDDGVTGSLVLVSNRREHAWSAQDLDIVQAIADEASRDIERARGHQADVDHALLDSVTGLVSHRQLLNVVDKEVARAARAGDTIAVIFSDLDGFKEINDVWGHDAGNRVLVMYADVLRSTLRREDTAARYGGDEFVCVLPGADREQAESVAQRVAQRFGAMTRNDPVIGSTSLSASHGTAVYPLDADTAESLIAAADAGLIRAKQQRARELTGRVTSLHVTRGS